MNYSAGCETPVSNIVMAITVIISLQFLTKLLYYTPTAILASIILSALPGLIDLNKVYKIWKVDKLDFLACVGAFFGVLFASVEIGLLVAVITLYMALIYFMCAILRMTGQDSTFFFTFSFYFFIFGPANRTQHTFLINKKYPPLAIRFSAFQTEKNNNYYNNYKIIKKRNHYDIIMDG